MTAELNDILTRAVDAAHLEEFGTRYSQTPRPWDFDVAQVVTADTVAMVLDQSDVFNTLHSKPFTLATWKLLVSITRSTVAPHLRDKVIGFALQQALRSIEKLMLETVQSECIGTAKFLSAQLVLLSKAAPNALWDVGCKHSPMSFVALLTICGAFQRKGRIDEDLARDFQKTIMPRIEASISICAPHTAGALEGDLAAVFRAHQNHIEFGPGLFHLMTIVCRALDDASFDLLDAWTRWLDDGCLTKPVSFLSEAVTCVAKQFDHSFFVDVDDMPVEGVQNGHKWWLVASKLVLLLPLGTFLPLLVRGLTATNDHSRERFMGLWLSVLTFSPTDVRNNIVRWLLAWSASFTTLNATVSLLVRVACETGICDPSNFVNLPITAAPRQMPAEYWNHAGLNAVSDPQVWATAWIVPPTVQQRLPSVGLLLAAGVVRGGGTLNPVGLNMSIRQLAESPADDIRFAFLSLLDALASAPSSIREVERVIGMLEGVRGLFSSGSATLLAQAAISFASWARQTSVSVEDGFLDDATLSELLRFFLELEPMQLNELAAARRIVRRQSEAYEGSHKRHRAEEISKGNAAELDSALKSTLAALKNLLNVTASLPVENFSLPQVRNLIEQVASLTAQLKSRTTISITIDSE